MVLPMVLVMVDPSVTIVVNTAAVEMAEEAPATTPVASLKMVVLPMVLVIVLPSVTMVVRTASVVIGIEDAAPTAPPVTVLNRVVLPTVVVMVLPSVVMVDTTASVVTGTEEAAPVTVLPLAELPPVLALPLAPVTPEAEPTAPVAVPAAVRPWVALRVAPAAATRRTSVLVLSSGFEPGRTHQPHNSPGHIE